MALEPGIDPIRRRVERDLVAADFELGVDAGLWRDATLIWPHLTVTIIAGDGNEFGMRLALDGYPATAPAGQPWDLQEDCPLSPACWPTGGTAPQVFRHDWSIQNGNAPYMACDRIGLATHPNWATDNPERAWHAGRTIAFYLSEIHHELRGATIPQPGLAA